MNVEGLWAVRFGDYERPDDLRNGGVIVFETDRVFGGDSFIAYTGSYGWDVDTLEVKVRAEKHLAGEVGDVWGGVGDRFDLLARLIRQPNGEFQGIMGRADQEPVLCIAVRKLQDLP